MGERRRRITWLIHNTLMAPMIIIRLPLWLLARAGEYAEAVLMRMPGLRRYDGWRGW